MIYDELYYITVSYDSRGFNIFGYYPLLKEALDRAATIKKETESWRSFWFKKPRQWARISVNTIPGQNTVASWEMVEPGVWVQGVGK